ncbi:cytochrome P450 [Schizophyllum fasciatum]
MPSQHEWRTFARWGDLYGGLASATILGQTLVIVNDPKIAVDLLDKRSSAFSDRPVMQMGGELVGWRNTLVLLPYGDRFRRFRRLFHHSIGTRASVKHFHPAEEIETRRFLRRVLAQPDALAAHIRKTAGAIILRISHGYEVREHGDPLVALADDATEQFSHATSPGGFLVNTIPALRHLPEWFPGAGFHATAREWAATLAQMVETPHNFVKQQMAKGIAPVSFTSRLLQQEKQLTAEDEFDIKWAAASLYSGGADTTVSSIYALFLALATNPAAARKAQAEIDGVTGGARLPTFADRAALPYVDALAAEVFRWHTVVVPAVPHRAMEDAVYGGYRIPKGALVMPNIWKFTHDPRTYADPFAFEPDRYFGPRAEPDPRQTVAFGFGRRVCPGSNLADASVFIAAAMALAVFDVSPAAGDGAPPVLEETAGTISHPKPYRCTIRPRSERAVALIQGDGAA